MRVLIIGGGTVGSAIYQLYIANYPSHAGPCDVHIHDPGKNAYAPPSDYDIVHVCFPHSFLYDKEIEKYLNNWTHPIVFIHSTLPPAMITRTRLVIPTGHKVVYAPITCNEQKMDEELLTRPLIIAPMTKLGDGLDLWKHIFNLGFEALEFESAEALALGKLMNTVDFYMQIVFAQMMRRICLREGVPFDEAYSDFRRYARIGLDYTKIDKTCDVEYIAKPVLVPGVVGGKCLPANLEIAASMVDPDFYKWLTESNKWQALEAALKDD